MGHFRSPHAASMLSRSALLDMCVCACACVGVCVCVLVSAFYLQSVAQSV